MYEDEDLQEIHEDIIELNEDISDLRRDLDNSTATISGSGEAVTLNGTAEARFKKPPLPMGNSEQESTTGKNLIPTSLNKMKTINTIGNWNDNVYSNLGLSIRINNDLSVVINGTSTSSGVFLICNNETLKAGTYILNEINTVNSNAVLYIWDSSWNNIYSTTSSGTFTISEDKSIKVGINISNGKTFSNFIVKPMISINGGDYEPYTNGASPNPDYPQTITNVTGDVEVLVQNKNLFDKNNMQNGFIPLSGDYPTSNPSYPNARYYLVPVKANDSVAISGSTNNFGRVRCIDNVSNQVIGTISTSENDYYTSNNNYSSGFVNAVITAKKDIILAFMVIQGTDTLDTFQVEYGSTATTYTPHQGQTFAFPLGNEKLMLGDYLADDGIHHVRGQVTFDGSDDETWEIARATLEKTIQFRLSESIYNTNVNDVSFLCNRFVHEKWIESYYPQKDEEYLSQITSTDIVISINRSRLSSEDVAGFKNWLSSNPLIIEHIREEEQQIVPYTTVQQEVYNAIKKAMSYYEQTNVFSLDEVSPIFIVKAFRNMNNSIESLQTRIELLQGRS